MWFLPVGAVVDWDYYVFNKLRQEGGVTMANVDTNSRLLYVLRGGRWLQNPMGADAPPACYDDLESCRAGVIAGSNMAWAHPVL